jgi:hypothetical protein
MMMGCAIHVFDKIDLWFSATTSWGVMCQRR